MEVPRSHSHYTREIGREKLGGFALSQPDVGDWMRKPSKSAPELGSNPAPSTASATPHTLVIGSSLHT